MGVRRAEEPIISPTFSARVASDIIAFACERGANRAVLMDILSLEQSHLSREDVRIPCATMAQMWRTAIEQTADPLLALHLAEARSLAANRTTSLIMESSATLLEAFELAAEYSVLIADVMDVEIGQVEDSIYIEFLLTDEWARQTRAVVQDCLNISYLSAAQAVQRLTGTRQPPTLLTFSLPKPPEISEYYRIFDCSMQFDSSFNRIGLFKVVDG